ncbi:MAG: hypothetical protein LBS98_01360 [Coriobacteriales bacterium]|jgi:hypothetical protein|nr:hypothetical protein [Coriobacteriales bacterium]
MTKQERLIEYIIQDVIEYSMGDKGGTIGEAMLAFYNSAVFDKLQDTETGLYLSGSAYVYDLFTSELENGRLVQLEV